MLLPFGDNFSYFCISVINGYFCPEVTVVMRQC